MLLFFFRPLLAIFRIVFSSRFSQEWAFFSWNQLTRPLLFSFQQAFLSTGLTLLIGLPAAYLFARYDFPARKMLRAFSLIPFILPTVVVAAAFNTLIGPRGWINLLLMQLFNLTEPPLSILNKLPAILLAHVFYNTSIVIRIVGQSLERLNPNMIEAAYVLQASPFQAWRKIALPLLMPSIAGAAMLAFLFNFTSFGVVLMLGGPGYATLEVAIYSQVFERFNLPMAGVLAIVQLTVTWLIAIVQNRVGHTGIRFGNAATANESSLRRRPERGAEKAFVITMCIFLVLLFILPLLSLAARSFVTLEAARGERGKIDTGFTFRYYAELFRNRQDSIFYASPVASIQHSLLYSFLTMIIATGIGLLTSYAIVITGKRFSRIMELLFMLPLGAGSVILGLGFLLTFNHAPWTSGRYPVILPIAHALIALPFVVRTMVPAIKSIPQNLRDAAAVMGANHWRVRREIDFPILSRALMVSLAFCFTISLGEFGASGFLANASTPTVPIAIFRYMSQPGALNYGQALAMSTLLMITCVAGSFFIERMRLPGKTETLPSGKYLTGKKIALRRR
jgi:thiamine transport system permease protein